MLSVASINRTSRSRQRPVHSWPRSIRGRRDAKPCSRARRPRTRMRTTTPGACRGPFPASSISGRSCAGSTSAFPMMPLSPTAPATTRPGCIGSIATANSAPSSPLIRLDGLWRSRGDRSEARASAANRRFMERRRLLPDERAGARNRDPTRPRDRLRRRRQRHVRDDQHAPGTHTIHRASAAPRWVNPDFAALARAYGAHGETVPPALRISLRRSSARSAVGRPALLHLKVDPQALTMNATLDALREQGLAAVKRSAR